MGLGAKTGFQGHKWGILREKSDFLAGFRVTYD
jgi:hypothetical protein